MSQIGLTEEAGRRAKPVNDVYIHLEVFAVEGGLVLVLRSTEGQPFSLETLVHDDDALVPSDPIEQRGEPSLKPASERVSAPDLQHVRGWLVDVNSSLGAKDVPDLVSHAMSEMGQWRSTAGQHPISRSGH